MKTSLILALTLGLALAGCNKSTRSSSTTSSDTTAGTSDYTATTGNTTTARNDFNAAANDLGSAAHSAANAIGNAASNVGVAARMTEWKLNPSDIQEDLNNDRDIVRTKEATAGAQTGTSDKSVIDSMVTSRLEADSDLAALKLHVSASREGEVTLRGKAHSAEEVGRAIALALDTEGVTKVTSKIDLDKDAKTNR